MLDLFKMIAMIKRVLSLSLLLTLFACSESIGIKGELISSIESKSNIGDLSAEEFDPSWIPVKAREAFMADFFEAIKSNKYEVFEYMPGEMIPMAKEDLQYLLHHVDTEFVENEIGDIEPIEINEIYDPSGIVYLKFKEDLFYDKASGGFAKEVKYVCPMEKVYNEDGSTRGYRGLFWVKIK